MRRSSSFVLAALIWLPVSALAADMAPIKEPVPSPSDLRKDQGLDRPQGQSPEARTPSPSDLASEPIRIDGDRTSSSVPDPRDADRRRAGTGATLPPSQTPVQPPPRRY